MPGTSQKKILFDFIENAPSIVFLVLLAVSNDIRLAGWVGASTALFVFVLFLLRGVAYHPILLGINLYMLLAAPSIEAAFRVNLDSLGDFLASHVQTSLMCTVFAVGLYLTCRSKTGFIGVDIGDPHVTRRLSQIMLALSAATIVWSVVFEGDRLVAIALPLMVLFGVRRYLLAGVVDRGPNGSTLSLTGATVIDAGANETG